MTSTISLARKRKPHCFKPLARVLKAWLHQTHISVPLWTCETVTAKQVNYLLSNIGFRHPTKAIDRIYGIFARVHHVRPGGGDTLKNLVCKQDADVPTRKHTEETNFLGG